MTENTGAKNKDPLHGVTLKNMLEDLVEYHGFPYLAEKIKIKVFSVNPTFNTSLKFLRKTPWAREKIEKLYIYHFVIRKEKDRPRKNTKQEGKKFGKHKRLDLPTFSSHMTVKKKLLLGIGNRLKMDDSAGSILAERLAARDYLSLDAGISPESYSGVIKREKPDLLIIVDATLMGLSPGEFRRIPGDKISTDSPMDTHSLSPAYFMEYIKEHAQEIMFIGIEPKRMDFGEQMSPEVLAALDRLEEIFLDGTEKQIKRV